jgi:hypothetical protein
MITKEKIEEVLLERIAEELEGVNDQDLHDRYDEMLDECNPTVRICGMEYSPSRVLREIDPTAYNCGFNDYVDAEGYDTDFEVDGLYYKTEDVENLREEIKDELEAQEEKKI